MKFYNKITTGWVTQTFDEYGKCTGQEFTAGDQVDYELYESVEEYAHPENASYCDNYVIKSIQAEDMPLKGDEYYYYDMVQPEN